jgi:hypothetical protein
MHNQLTSTPTSLRRPRLAARHRRWLIGTLAALAVLAVAALGATLWRMNYVPAGLDVSTTRLSDQGLFQITYLPDRTPIPINQLHTWTLHIETADGEPIEDATILVDGDMPQHGHGLPTQPVVTQVLGDGNYLLEGLKFQMGGWWVMEFAIQHSDKSDVVQFNMLLE